MPVGQMIVIGLVMAGYYLALDRMIFGSWIWERK